MTTVAAPSVLTLRRTFSFYLPARDIERIRFCSLEADAVVVFGAEGPKSIRHLRSQGWDAHVLFDRAGYASRLPVRVAAWMESQLEAGADRLLTPGCWVGWGHAYPSFADQVAAEMTIASSHDATAVLAIDHRWFTKAVGQDALLGVLRAAEQPVALVLSDRADPLSHVGAVEALISVTRNIRNVTVLRADHGAIGALAFDAAHGSIGLVPGHRHFVPPDASASAIPNDTSARVFVPDLMDWFAASKIAGWATVRVSPICTYLCCDGQRIDRFFDPRFKADADRHNRIVLAALADQILSAPSEVRRRLFAGLCQRALERYGVMGGLTTVIKPKSQLCQWAQFA